MQERRGTSWRPQRKLRRLTCGQRMFGATSLLLSSVHVAVLVCTPPPHVAEHVDHSPYCHDALPGGGGGEGGEGGDGGGGGEGGGGEGGGEGGGGEGGGGDGEGGEGGEMSRRCGGLSVASRKVPCMHDPRRA